MFLLKQDRKYLSLEKARLKKANLDWVDFKPGNKVVVVVVFLLLLFFVLVLRGPILWYFFMMLFKVVLTFESVDEILQCDHSSESY